jgi:SIR2-like protein
MAEPVDVGGGVMVNVSDLRALHAAWARRELVLFLGAGVSIPYGVPSWQSLVLELLFDQAESTRRLGPMWPHYRRAVASWMTDYFAYDPLVLARLVEHSLSKREGAVADGEITRFLERVREHLYARLHPPGSRTLLRAVADLLARPDAGVPAVVTFNFDDLLEAELEERNVPFAKAVGPDRQSGTGVRVLHVHGFVPQAGPIARAPMVFTEPDYHRLTESMFHWGLSEIVDALRKRTVLFLGLSMSDPSLRRLLDASRNAPIPPHYQVQKRHAVEARDLPAAMADVERRARRYAEQMGTGYDEAKRPDELADAVQAAVAQADTYDREVFESMGVKTIWVSAFDQIPAVVDAIADPPPAAGL